MSALVAHPAIAGCRAASRRRAKSAAEQAAITVELVEIVSGAEAL